MSLYRRSQINWGGGVEKQNEERECKLKPTLYKDGSWFTHDDNIIFVCENVQLLFYLRETTFGISLSVCYTG